jgi:hypothetical protein
MNTRTVRLGRFSAAVCATAITAVSAWAFVTSTASLERDPFQFASIMAANAEVRIAQTAVPHHDRLPQEVRVYELPGLLTPAPVCPGVCS